MPHIKKEVPSAHMFWGIIIYSIFTWIINLIGRPSYDNSMYQLMTIPKIRVSVDVVISSACRGG